MDMEGELLARTRKFRASSRAALDIVADKVTILKKFTTARMSTKFPMNSTR